MFLKVVCSTFQSGYTAQSSRDRADRMHAGNTLGSSTNTQRFVTNILQATAYVTPANTTVKWSETLLNRLFLLFRPPCKPSFNNVVKSPLGLNRRASTANQREAGGLSSQEQRAESSSSCFSNGLVYSRLTRGHKVKASTLCSVFMYFLSSSSVSSRTPFSLKCCLIFAPPDGVLRERLTDCCRPTWPRSGSLHHRRRKVAKAVVKPLYKDLVWCSDALN